MAPPWYQKSANWIVWIIAGLLFLGSVLDSFSGAINLITPAITYIGTALLVGGTLVLISLLLLSPLPWLAKSNQVIRIKTIGLKPIFGLVGAVILLWIPRLADYLNRPTEITILVAPYNSGTADPTFEKLSTLRESNFEGLVGDNADDLQVKLFLTFDVSEVPTNARILNATLQLGCNSIVNDPTGLGNLFIESWRYEQYARYMFDARIPLFSTDGTYYDGWSAEDLTHTCNHQEALVSSNRKLIEVIQNSLLFRPKVVQFVINFEEPVLRNKQSDGIFMTIPYKLVIEYDSQQ